VSHILEAYFLGSEKGEAVGEAAPQHSAKDGTSARSGAIGLILAVIENVSDEV
jgi:hypothetical protein